MPSQTFQAQLEQDADGTWWYVHVPKKIRDSFKEFERRGIIHVSVTIGNTTWDGSMLPWADGSAQVSIHKKIRAKEGLERGDTLLVTVRPR
ncbi:MAG TPA: DUF1905 domain-containing protein [Candidatus Saccharimonadales bacterium]|nr:DUF1905 domain-containing protein [Candidatus Saccharimonadales bacterium]